MGRTKDGKPILIVGLTRENLDALPQDYPIFFDAGEVGLQNLMVMIVGGENDIDITKRLSDPQPFTLDGKTGTLAKLDQERAEFRAVIEDLWGCIGAKEIEHLQPETVEFAKANHQVVSH